MRFDPLNDALRRLGGIINSPYKHKTDDEMAEDFIKEQKIARPAAVVVPSSNPFTPDVIDRLEVVGEAIQGLPEGAIKEQIYFLFNVANEAAYAIRESEQQTLMWKAKADAYLLEFIKETWVKQARRESQGNLGRAY